MDYEDYDDEVPASQESKGAVKISATTLEYDAQRMFDSIASRATAAIVKACGDDIRKAVSESVQKQISEKVGAIIDKRLEEGIQKHDEWGTAVGSPTTLTAMIGKAGQDYLGQRVNDRGEANSYGDKTSRLEFIVKKNVESVIDYKMQGEIKKAVELAVTQAQSKVAEAVAKLIK